MPPPFNTHGVKAMTLCLEPTRFLPSLRHKTMALAREEQRVPCRRRSHRSSGRLPIMLNMAIGCLGPPEQLAPATGDAPTTRGRPGIELVA